MSTADSPNQESAKAKRILSCIQCQQRKVKCDRKTPCVNCVRYGTQCVAATPTARRKRNRFPEKELLKRLRNLEVRLSENNIEFEPLQPPTQKTLAQHGDTKGIESASAGGLGRPSNDGSSSARKDRDDSQPLCENCTPIRIL